MGSPVITWPIGIVISGSQQCNAYVFGTESFSETLAEFRSQTHPFTVVHTLLSGQPQQETQGLYLTDSMEPIDMYVATKWSLFIKKIIVAYQVKEQNYSEYFLFFHLIGDSNLFDEQGPFCCHIHIYWLH